MAMDERGKAFESKWAHDAEMRFKVEAKRNRALGEWAAAKKCSLSYGVIEQSGPDHAPHFVIETRVGTHPPERGEGGSKREAQRAAASAFLRKQGVDV